MRGCIVFRRISALVAGVSRCCEDNGKRIREMLFSSYPYISMEEDYE